MKTSKEKLIKEISEYLIIYLKSGKLSLNSFIKDINLDIKDMDQLLKIHFILRDDVKNFVQELNKMIRSFKTSTITTNQLLFGEVKGHIDWQKTIINRLNINYEDKTIFSCNERYKNYNIKENLVLKELLRTIYNIVFNDIDLNRVSSYSWFSKWELLKNELNYVYKKNIYIKKIKDKNVNVTDRMINDTLKSRNQLYREAARLLAAYRRIMNYRINKEEVSEMLSQTFITPEKESVLFELYWVISLIKNNAMGEKLYLVNGRENMVAKWEDELYAYEIYHDSTGSGELLFQVNLDEVDNSENDFLNRSVCSYKKAMKLSEQIFRSNLDKSYWRGRPDILIEIKDKNTNTLKKVIIGEVKYTDKIETAKIGLKELLEYIMLVKDSDSNYLYNEEKGEVEIKGILFLDNVEALDIENELVKVINTNDTKKSIII